MNEIESQIAVYDTINGDDIDKYKYFDWFFATL